jgi:hypothetical protein
VGKHIKSGDGLTTPLSTNTLLSSSSSASSTLADAAAAFTSIIIIIILIIIISSSSFVDLWESRDCSCFPAWLSFLGNIYVGVGSVVMNPERSLSKGKRDASGMDFGVEWIIVRTDETAWWILC